VQPGNCFANRRPAKEEILARIRYRNQRAKPVVPIAQGSGSVDEHGAMNGGSRCKSCGIAQSPITSGPGTVCVKSESADNRLRRSKKPHKRDSRRQRDRVGTPTRVRVLPKRSTSGRRCCNALLMIRLSRAGCRATQWPSAKTMHSGGPTVSVGDVEGPSLRPACRQRGRRAVNTCA